MKSLFLIITFLGLFNIIASGQQNVGYINFGNASNHINDTLLISSYVKLIEYSKGSNETTLVLQDKNDTTTTVYIIIKMNDLINFASLANTESKTSYLYINGDFIKAFNFDSLKGHQVVVTGKLVTNSKSQLVIYLVNSVQLWDKDDKEEIHEVHGENSPQIKS